MTECNLWAVVSLPPNVFVNAGAGAKTNLLFFSKGSATNRVWYYDLADVKVTKTRPLTSDHFSDCFDLLALPADAPERMTERSWWRSYEEIKDDLFDLRAANPNTVMTRDERSPEELLDLIAEAQANAAAALAKLSELRASGD